MNGIVHVALACHFVGFHITQGRTSPLELAAGSVFGVVVFLITRGRPVAPLALKVSSPE